MEQPYDSEYERDVAVAKAIAKREMEQFMREDEQLRVEIHLESTSEPIIYEDAMAVYQKGDMMCVSFKRDGTFMSDKYPISHIFRVRNTYTGKKDPEEELEKFKLQVEAEVARIIEKHRSRSGPLGKKRDEEDGL